MALTPLQVTNVCAPRTGDYKDTCRYLCMKKMTCVCTKQAPTEFAALNKGRTWVKPADMGDNCQGYPYLKWTPQGYDV